MSDVRRQTSCVIRDARGWVLAHRACCHFGNAKYPESDCSVSKPVLILVSGPPASGKSTIALRIANVFGLPLVTKDGFKEVLADALGVAGREWSSRLGGASFALIDHVAGLLLYAGVSVIVEGNFDPGRGDTALTALVRDLDLPSVQVLCRASGDVLLARYDRRATSRERHPIHTDDEHAADAGFRERLASGYLGPLDLGGTLLDVDTTDFDAVDIAPVVAAIRRALDGAG